jgi:hypothetical protein
MVQQLARSGQDAINEPPEAETTKSKQHDEAAAGLLRIKTVRACPSKNKTQHGSDHAAPLRCLNDFPIIRHSVSFVCHKTIINLCSFWVSLIPDNVRDIITTAKYCRYQMIRITNDYFVLFSATVVLYSYPVILPSAEPPNPGIRIRLSELSKRWPNIG